MKNYALVYLVDDDPTNELKDTGNDPDFSSPPTWGICRPDIRNETEINEGSILLFIARVRTSGQNKYFLKGFFEVAEKINIIQAYSRFGKRQNVIISTQKRQNENIDWGNTDWQDCFIQSKIKEIPEFLKTVKNKGINYYQKDNDNHQLDNWKCRRIYNCKIESFRNCIANKYCQKENELNENVINSKENPQLKNNYIVGDKDNYKDWSYLKVEWRKIASLIDKSENLMVANRHPEVILTDAEFAIIKEYMNKKENEQKSC